MRRAERSTAGEIYCIVARASADYRETPLVWATAAAFIPPLLALLFGWTPAWPAGLSGAWVAQSGAPDVTGAVLSFAAAQAALFALTAALVAPSAMRLRLTPGVLKRARVRRAAVDLFLAHGLQATEARTGALIYASLAERRVEVVADKTIHSQVDPEVWGEAAAALTAALARGEAAAGFVKAIALCGAVLAEHFPARDGDRNELPDRLVEL
jgi:putative membrane protein